MVGNIIKTKKEIPLINWTVDEYTVSKTVRKRIENLIKGNLVFNSSTQFTLDTDRTTAGYSRFITIAYRINSAGYMSLTNTSSYNGTIKVLKSDIALKGCTAYNYNSQILPSDYVIKKNDLICINTSNTATFPSNSVRLITTVQVSPERSIYQCLNDIVVSSIRNYSKNYMDVLTPEF